jgi:ABC-type uncharacterized transport system fused permease/ATPase subunit
VVLKILKVGLYGLYKFYENYTNKRKINEENLNKLVETVEKKNDSVKVDMIFFKRLYKIIRIIIPKVASKEFQYFITLTVLLLFRTFLTVQIAEVLGRNAQYLVGRQYKKLFYSILYFAGLTLPASAVNSGLKYCTNMLSLRIRVRLSRHVHDKYLKG